MQGQELHGFSGVDPLPSFPLVMLPRDPRWPLVSSQAPFACPTLSFPGRKAHTFRQSAWKKESRLLGGRGMARVTLGGLFLKERLGLHQQVFPGGQGVWGNQDGLRWLALPRLPVSNLSPTLYTDVSLLAFCATLLTFQELEQSRAKPGPRGPEELPVEIFPPPSSNCWPPSPPPALGEACLTTSEEEGGGEKRWHTLRRR